MDADASRDFVPESDSEDDAPAPAGAVPESREQKADLCSVDDVMSVLEEIGLGSAGGSVDSPGGVEKMMAYIKRSAQGRLTRCVRKARAGVGIGPDVPVRLGPIKAAALEAIPDKSEETSRHFDPIAEDFVSALAGVESVRGMSIVTLTAAYTGILALVSEYQLGDRDIPLNMFLVEAEEARMANLAAEIQAALDEP